MLYTWLLVVALAAGAAFAEEEDCCSTEDRDEIVASWNKVWASSHTSRKVKIMSAVIHEVFSANPDAKALVAAKGLTDETSPAFKAYLVRVAHQFDLVINMLEDPAILDEQIHFLADKFGAKVNLKKHYFTAVADAMEHVLPHISTCFNVGAWNRCMRRLGTAISAKVTAA
jgi:hypothetical protein